MIESIATSFVRGFGSEPKYRPSSMEDIIVGLLSTLIINGLLDEAVKVIEDNAGLDFTGDIKSIKGVGSHSSIPFMYKSPISIMILLSIIPNISTMSDHIILDIPIGTLNGSNKRRALLKALDIINMRNMGIKVYNIHGTSDKLGVIKYNTQEDIMRIVQTLDLSPQTIDRITQW